ADPGTRRRVLDEGRGPEGEWLGANGPVAWSDVLIAECPTVPGAEGRTLAEVAAARQIEPAHAMVDLLLEAEGRVSMVHFLMLDTNVARGRQHPHVTTVSDPLGLRRGPHEAPPPTP